jgi:hypothetical protein
MLLQLVLNTQSRRVNKQGNYIKHYIAIFLIILVSFIYGCAGFEIMGRGIPIPVPGAHDYYIESDPPDVEVFLNGKLIGRTPLKYTRSLLFQTIETIRIEAKMPDPEKGFVIAFAEVNNYLLTYGKPKVSKNVIVHSWMGGDTHLTFVWKPLHDAAKKGDIEEVKRLITKGYDVNAKDINGNTPLHDASYEGNKILVDLLIANGADVNTINNEGISALDMEKLALVDNLIISGANYIDNNANWTDWRQGREIYGTLKKISKMKKEIVIASLARQTIKPDNRLKILFLGIKLGIPESEEKLISILMDRGDSEMAVDFLNSGSKKLYEGGERWANAHGYTIIKNTGSSRVSWGRF